MSATTVAVLCSAIGTLVSILTAGLMVRWHCRNEDIRVGHEQQAALDMRRRVESLEEDRQETKR